MKCNKCNHQGYHIADGLYLCPDCEKGSNFHLVQDIETKELRWKDLNKDTIVDEIIVSQ